MCGKGRIKKRDLHSLILLLLPRTRHKWDLKGRRDRGKKKKKHNRSVRIIHPEQRGQKSFPAKSHISAAKSRKSKFYLQKISVLLVASFRISINKVAL